MSPLQVYPRLPAHVAEQRLAAHTGQAVEDLRRLSATTDLRASWYPTAPYRVAENDLRTLQETVRAISAEAGWPAPPTKTKGTAFDRKLAPALYRQMAIVPADAASEDVWSFLSLVLLPDIAFWRWPNEQRRPGYERIIGRPRNVFRRLWTRIHSLGEDLGAQLYEDEAVAILERPTLGAHPRVARAIAQGHLGMAGESGTARTEILRITARRLRRLAVVVSLETLDDAQLADLVERYTKEAIDQSRSPTDQVLSRGS
ncbi:hypothetical protein GCM10027280_04960 [Micromonospora polyrhachis]|uniref:Uncharacterized protein n=1 Tax=Micromonospora polyrhachis TaxID=1282883 RepID=A0A7W7SKQ8_9ACTN|nr:hypothetical protein [Micromonospora polyrhachis]MBB4956594.1 hypothetical protein [Micromonospora polyrhachis]